jgi:hypothetical protein
MVLRRKGCQKCEGRVKDVVRSAVTIHSERCGMLRTIRCGYTERRVASGSSMLRRKKKRLAGIPTIATMQASGQPMWTRHRHDQ